MVAALERTRESACLATPDFVPGAKLRGALAQAAARGVNVELLIAGYLDHPTLRWAAHALLPRLIDRGVRVYEYERSMMHAKAAVFDGKHAILGSSNLDRQSLAHSYEVNLIVQGGELPEQISSMLCDDIRGSRQLKAAELRCASRSQRARNRGAAFFLTRT